MEHNTMAQIRRLQPGMSARCPKEYDPNHEGCKECLALVCEYMPSGNEEEDKG